MTKARVNADNASADIQGVTAGTGLTGGGTSGTVTLNLDTTAVIQPTIFDAKADLLTATADNTPARLAVGNNGETLVADSSTATGLKWQAPTVNTVIDAKGDLLAGTANDTITRLGVGSNDQVLTADSTTATGLKWATPVAGMTNPMTTTGDIIYSSPNSTPVRRGIGSTGQVLTVSGGVPVWATPTASGLTTTLIANGTLSGASLTLSSLSSYDQITVLFELVAVSAAGQFRCRVNNNSTNNYWGVGNAQVGSSSNSNYYYPSSGITSFDNLASSGFAAGQNYFAFTFFNCKNVGFTNFTYTGSFINGSNTRTNEVIAGGVYAVAEAVSSLVFFNTGGSFSGGTYRIYGA